MKRRSANVVDRVLALLLMVGGLLGVGLSVVTLARFLRMHWVYGVVFGAILVLFAWTALAGFRLWRGEPRGWKSATVLFAMQVPILTVPGLSYEYYTGLALRLVGGHVDKGLTLSLGSNGNFYLDTRIHDWVYGINLVGLAATVYLLTRRRHYTETSAPA